MTTPSDPTEAPTQGLHVSDIKKLRNYRILSYIELGVANFCALTLWGLTFLMSQEQIASFLSVWLVVIFPSWAVGAAAATFWSRTLKRPVGQLLRELFVWALIPAAGFAFYLLVHLVGKPT